MNNEKEAFEKRIEEREAKEKAELAGMKKLHVWKTLTDHLGGCVGQCVLAWLFVGIEVVCEVLIPFFAQYLINILDPSAEALAASGASTAGDYISMNMGSLWGYAVLMLGMAVLSCTGGIFAGYFAAGASARFGKNLRQAMYYKIQEYSFSNIDRFSTSSLVTRLTTDVTNVQNAFQMILRMLVRAPMMMVFALVMAMITNWKLGLIFLAIMPFLAAVLFGIAIVVHPTFVRVFNAYDDLNASVQENLQGIRVVKSYDREAFENEKFGKVSYFIYRTFLHAERLLAFNSPAMQLSTYTAILLIAWFGGKMIIATGNAPESFNTGNLTSLFTYVMQILNSLNMVAMVFVQITVARNSAERIVQVVNEKPDLASPEHPVLEVKDGSIDFEHVGFRYYKDVEKDVLHDVTVHIPSGSTVGIIGATGSSKTSLVNLIARLYDATSGSVKVGGVDVKDYDIATLRDAVSVVLQKNVLFSGTVRSNLLWGNPDATDEEIRSAAHLACADEFIERLPGGYDAPIDQGGTNVSGGQRQRLCIARALLKSPKILILDDSTSAVDTKTDATIRHAFETEIPNVTKLIVAQRVLSIKDCDKILVLDDGKIIGEGSNEELMESCGVYREIYETQVGGGDFDAKSEH